MGRKKKQRTDQLSQLQEEGSATVLDSSSIEPVNSVSVPDDFSPAPVPISAPELFRPTTGSPADATLTIISDEKKTQVNEPTPPQLPAPFLKSHTVPEYTVPDDIYVSSDEGEPEEDFLRADGATVEILLGSSKLGLMRKGPLLIRTQWVRGDPTYNADNTADLTHAAQQERLQVGEDEEDMEDIIDPAAKAAKELAEKQRQLELAKDHARRLESAENAGRDPCLFSKRTAFDIRMDQIEDRPWLRGDPTDFFNYGLTEDDWIEYAERQLVARQELTDAARQKRLPDPTIVPAMPKAPTKQSPRVAVLMTKTNANGEKQEDGAEKTIGPSLPEVVVPERSDTEESANNSTAISAAKPTLGGAWGAAAVPGSILAQLIEAQERGIPVPPPIHAPPPPPPPPPPQTIEVANPVVESPVREIDHRSAKRKNRDGDITIKIESPSVAHTDDSMHQQWQQHPQQVGEAPRNRHGGGGSGAHYPNYPQHAPRGNYRGGYHLPGPPSHFPPVPPHFPGGPPGRGGHYRGFDEGGPPKRGRYDFRGGYRGRGRG